MDPNETLTRMRDAMAALRTALEEDGPDDVDELVGGDPIEDAAVDLLDAVEDLDEWLTKGGFVPDAWVRHNHVTRDAKPRGKCPACDRGYRS